MFRSESGAETANFWPMVDILPSKIARSCLTCLWCTIILVNSMLLDAPPRTRPMIVSEDEEDMKLPQIPG